MQQIRRIVAVRGERIRPQPRAATLNRRKKCANRFLAQPEALDEMLFERYGIQAAGNFISLILRWDKLRFLRGLAGKPARQFFARTFADRRATHLFAYG